jgi:hypothetical protein
MVGRLCKDVVMMAIAEVVSEYTFLGQMETRILPAWKVPAFLRLGAQREDG